MPSTISHSGFLTRSWSVCGSLRSLIGVSSDSLISLGVRCRTNTGLPRHFTVTICPTSTLEMSISVEARARVEASGLIWLIRGQTTDPMPTAPTAPVAMKSMSLRVTEPVFTVAVDNESLQSPTRPREERRRSRVSPGGC